MAEAEIACRVVGRVIEQDLIREAERRRDREPEHQAMIERCRQDLRRAEALLVRRKPPQRKRSNTYETNTITKTKAAGGLP
jgi:hypothetical protein